MVSVVYFPNPPVPHALDGLRTRLGAKNPKAYNSIRIDVSPAVAYQLNGI